MTRMVTNKKSIRVKIGSIYIKKTNEKMLLDRSVLFLGSSGIIF